jgi:hypothetical protein
VEAALLAEHADAGPVEHLESDVVGGEVAVVLPGPGARQPPVVEAVQGLAHLGGSGRQQPEQVVDRHDRRRYSRRAWPTLDPSRPPRRWVFGRH